MLARLGLVTAYGHVSARAGTSMLITPAAGLACVTAAGYDGYVEVEIFNQQIWDAPPDQTAATVRQRFAGALGSG